MAELEHDLAAYAHEAWAGWMWYLFTRGHLQGDGSFVIDAVSVERWQRQMTTPYDALPEAEQRSDIKEAREIIAIVNGGKSDG